MKWTRIIDERPVGYPEYYLRTHDTSGDDRVLVFGYDVVNFYPRYEVQHVNDIAALTLAPDGRYIFNELIITHWATIERP